MTHDPRNYEPPFKDNIQDTWENEIARVVAIGKPALIEWANKVAHDTHPETYGHTGADWTYAVAASLRDNDLGAYATAINDGARSITKAFNQLNR